MAVKISESIGTYLLVDIYEFVEQILSKDGARVEFSCKRVKPPRMTVTARKGLNANKLPRHRLLIGWNKARLAQFTFQSTLTNLMFII